MRRHVRVELSGPAVWEWMRERWGEVPQLRIRGEGRLGAGVHVVDYRHDHVTYGRGVGPFPGAGELTIAVTTPLDGMENPDVLLLAALAVVRACTDDLPARADLLRLEVADR